MSHRDQDKGKDQERENSEYIPSKGRKSYWGPNYQARFRPGAPASKQPPTALSKGRSCAKERAWGGDAGKSKVTEQEPLLPSGEVFKRRLDRVLDNPT